MCTPRLSRDTAAQSGVSSHFHHAPSGIVPRPSRPGRSGAFRQARAATGLPLDLRPRDSTAATADHLAGGVRGAFFLRQSTRSAPERSQRGDQGTVCCHFPTCRGHPAAGQPWTPNKVWPKELWRELIPALLDRFDVIEAGTEALFSPDEFGPGFHAWAGTTSLADFVWTLSQATVFVGPSSGGMHLANAFRVPSVILFGGYESPDGYRFPPDPGLLPGGPLCAVLVAGRLSVSFEMPAHDRGRRCRGRRPCFGQPAEHH